jgi:transposase-like protein
MSKNRFTDEAKVELVLASFGEKGSITEFCERNGIPRTTFYAWHKALLAHLSKSIAPKKSDRHFA